MIRKYLVPIALVVACDSASKDPEKAAKAKTEASADAKSKDKGAKADAKGDADAKNAGGDAKQGHADANEGADAKADAKPSDAKADTDGKAVADAKAGADVTQTADAGPGVAPEAFVEAIRKLDYANPEKSAKAMAMFNATFGKPGAAIDEATRRKGMEALFEFWKGNIPQLTNGEYDSPHIEPAICYMSKNCLDDEMNADIRAKVTQFKSLGLRVAYLGEGEYDLELDYAWLTSKMAPGLSANAKAFYLAKAWEADKVDDAWDEPGFVGNADDVAAAILKWEAVGSASDAVWSSDANINAGVMARSYLEICLRDFERPPCLVTPEYRASYERFMKDRASSRYQPAVAHFMATMSKSRFRSNEDKLEKLIEASMKKVASP